MEDINYKEVNYAKFCRKCKHWNNGSEENAACAECLEEFYRDGTEKPVRYEEA